MSDSSKKRKRTSLPGPVPKGLGGTVSQAVSATVKAQLADRGLLALSLERTTLG